MSRRTVLPLGLWFLLSAEPDIYLLSKTPKSPHRRLSLCSLPAPKQTDGSLGSCHRRSARHLRGLAACAPSNPDVLFLAGRVTLPPCLLRVLRRARSPVFCVLLQACRRPSFWLRRASPDSCSLVVALAHRREPVRGCIEEPVSRPPREPAECACSFVWRWAFEPACPRSFAPRCRAHNS